MKFIRMTSAAGIFLCFGAMIPVYAQGGGKQNKSEGQEKGGQTKGKQTQETGRPAQQDGPSKQEQRAQQPQERQQKQQSAKQSQQQPERTREQAQAWQQQRGWAPQGSWQGHETWQQSRAQNWSSDHRTWTQRGGYGGYYVPQASFVLYFGSQHFFRLQTRPVIYLGYPRFEYGGFSFLLVDPYPEYWADNWYSSDDVYIDFDDGYYLYNRGYPQVRLAITIAL